MHQPQFGTNGFEVLFNSTEKLEAVRFKTTDGPLTGSVPAVAIFKAATSSVSGVTGIRVMDQS